MTCSSTGRSSCIATPSGRMPVPASRTSACPLSSRTSTHDVLPPYLTVSGPGAATEPRHPQTRALHQSSRSSGRVSPRTPRPRRASRRSRRAAGTRWPRTRGARRRTRSPGPSWCAGRCSKNATPRRRVAAADRLAVRRRQLRAPRRTRPTGSRPARRTACRAAARPRRCRRRACRPRRAGTSASRGSPRARGPGSAAGSSVSRACRAAHSRFFGSSSSLTATPHIVAGYEQRCQVRARPGPSSPVNLPVSRRGGAALAGLPDRLEIRVEGRAIAVDAHGVGRDPAVEAAARGRTRSPRPRRWAVRRRP